MTLVWNCPQCYEDVINPQVDESIAFEDEDIEFECKDCGCCFTVECTAPTIRIDKNGKIDPKEIIAGGGQVK